MVGNSITPMTRLRQTWPEASKARKAMGRRSRKLGSVPSGLLESGDEKAPGLNGSLETRSKVTRIAEIAMNKDCVASEVMKIQRRREVGWFLKPVG